VQELAERRIPLSEYQVATFRSVQALAQQARLIRHIARRRIAIVHAYNFYGNVFALGPARLARVPVVIASVRDRGPYLTRLQKRVQRAMCRVADRILVNAEAVRDWLIGQGYDSSRITIIRNGVDTRRFVPVPPAARVALRASLGIAPEAPVVAVVSRLSPLKGLEQFLDATARLADRYPTAKFLLIGGPSVDDPGYLDELKRLAASLRVADRVTFTGVRADVPALLATATVSVMPSLDEALSNVVLESMAAGAPTVATRVGGTPEAMTDRVTGLLVPPGDAAALADAIGYLLDHAADATALGETARRRIHDEFSVERMVVSTEELYLDLLARKARARVPTSWQEHTYFPSPRS
jgi:glycosyltransferase involved in cell wall biosynthesis